MAELTELEIDAALERGKAARKAEPRAISACYDPVIGKVVVTLTNGCGFSFPPALAQGLERASPSQLARVELLGAGYGLHWEDLDVDLSVPGLLAGIFGTKAHMARQAGSTRTSAKAAAARANGAKGGRPRKATAA
jgi:Protein of unknown function (DUF2442)